MNLDAATSGEEPPRSDFQLLGDYVRRNWWLILVCTAAALVAGVLYIKLAKPSYRATAVVLIQPQGPVGDRETAPQLATPELVRGQLEILRSQNVLSATVAKLHLDSDHDFIRKVPASSNAAVRNAAAREELLDRLELANDGRSFIVSLTATAAEPNQAASIANTTVASYIEVGRDQKVQAIERNQQVLQRRLDLLRSMMIDAEQQAEAFRVRAGLVPLSSVPEDSESYAASTPASREIIEMSKEHASLAAQRAQAQARYGAQQRAIAAGQGQSTAEVLSSSVVADLRIRESQLAERRSELLARYSPDHPLVAPVEAELAQVRNDISREVQRIHSSLRSQASASSAAFSSADAFMRKLANDRSRDITASTRLRQLQRDAQIRRETYEEYAMQAQRASGRAELQLPDALLISPASPPLRATGRPAAVVLFGFGLAGLIFGLMLGLLRSVLASRRRVFYETVISA
ncbi:MAG: GumC family protein [Croceibacterium sp.]